MLHERVAQSFEVFIVPVGLLDAKPLRNLLDRTLVWHNIVIIDKVFCCYYTELVFDEVALKLIR